MNLICETCVRQRDVNEFCPKQLPKEGESCQQYHEADWSKIKQLQAELGKHRWIPVSERLPDRKGLYSVLWHNIYDGNIQVRTCNEYIFV